MTPRERQVYDFIGETIRTRGISPSTREIMAMLGVASTSNVDRIVKGLEKKGHIRRTPYAKRALRLADADQQQILERMYRAREIILAEVARLEAADPATARRLRAAADQLTSTGEAA